MRSIELLQTVDVAAYADGPAQPALSTASGVTITFGAGTHLVQNVGFGVAESVKLVGAGAGAAVIDCDGADTAFIFRSAQGLEFQSEVVGLSFVNCAESAVAVAGASVAVRGCSFDDMPGSAAASAVIERHHARLVDGVRGQLRVLVQLWRRRGRRDQRQVVRPHAGPRRYGQQLGFRERRRRRARVLDARRAERAPDRQQRRRGGRRPLSVRHHHELGRAARDQQLGVGRGRRHVRAGRRRHRAEQRLCGRQRVHGREQPRRRHVRALRQPHRHGLDVCGQRRRAGRRHCDAAGGHAGRVRLGVRAQHGRPGRRRRRRPGRGAARVVVLVLAERGRGRRGALPVPVGGNTTLHANDALSTHGGAVWMAADTEDVSLDSGARVTCNNAPGGGGGAVYWEDAAASTASDDGAVTLADNTAHYGANFASKPVALALAPGAVLDHNSGETFAQSIQVEQLDAYNQRVTSDSSTSATVSPVDDDTSLTGPLSALFSEGVANFTGLGLTANPATASGMYVDAADIELLFEVDVRACYAVLEEQQGQLCGKICPAGSYLDTSESLVGECVDCPVNTYFEGSGATSEGQCVECPANTFSGEGSALAEDCLPVAGFVSVEDEACDVGFCVEVCADGFDCSAPGYRLDSVPVEPAFWHEADYVGEPRECFFADACVGGTLTGEDSDVLCADGYTGPYCAVCADGFGKTPEGECVECDTDTEESADTKLAVGIVLVVVGLVAVAVASRWTRDKLAAMKKAADEDEEEGEVAIEKRAAELRDKMEGSGVWNKVKIIIAFAQVLSSFADTFGASVEYPEEFSKLAGSLDFVNLDFVGTFSPACSYAYDFYDTLLATTLAPVVLTLCIAAAYVPLCSYLGSRAAKTHCVSAFLTLTFLVYPSITAVCFATFSCWSSSPFASRTARRLDTWPFSTRPTSRAPGGAPAQGAVLKVTVEGTASQVVLGMLFGLTALMVLTQSHPYLDGGDDRLAVVCSLQLFLTLFATLLLKVDVSEEDDYSQGAFDACLVLINVVGIACSTSSRAPTPPTPSCAPSTPTCCSSASACSCSIWAPRRVRRRGGVRGRGWRLGR